MCLHGGVEDYYYFFNFLLYTTTKGNNCIIPHSWHYVCLNINIIPFCCRNTGFVLVWLNGNVLSSALIFKGHKTNNSCSGFSCIFK